MGNEAPSSDEPVRHWNGAPCLEWSAWHYAAAKAVCLFLGGSW